MDGKSVRKPYKLYITSPRHRGHGGFSRPKGGHSSGDRGDGWSRKKVDLGEEREDFLEEVDSRVRSLTKARQQEDLGCQGKQ